MDKIFFSGFFGDSRNRRLNSDEDNTEQTDNLGESPEQQQFNNFFFGPFHNFSDAHSNIFREMESMFQNMFSASFRSIDLPTIDDNFSTDGNPRNHMLKESEDIWKFPESRNFPFHSLLESQDGKDTDIDAKVAKGGLFSAKDFYEEPSSNYVFKKFTSVRTIHLPDGTIEEQRTVTDENGQKVSKVTRTIGDQTHQVVVHTDGEEIKAKEENFINMEEGNLLDFEQKWNHLKHDKQQVFLKGLESNQESLQDNSKNLFIPPGDSKYLSLFKKYFGLSS